MQSSLSVDVYAERWVMLSAVFEDCILALDEQVGHRLTCEISGQGDVPDSISNHIYTLSSVVALVIVLGDKHACPGRNLGVQLFVTCSAVRGHVLGIRAIPHAMSV